MAGQVNLALGTPNSRQVTLSGVVIDLKKSESIKLHVYGMIHLKDLGDFMFGTAISSNGESRALALTIDCSCNKQVLTILPLPDRPYGTLFFF
jgi:hypothetical protein